MNTKTWKWSFWQDMLVFFDAKHMSIWHRITWHYWNTRHLVIKQIQNQKENRDRQKLRIKETEREKLLIRMGFLYCFHREVKGQHHWSWCGFSSCVLIHSLDPLKDTKPEGWDLNLYFLTKWHNIAPQRSKLMVHSGAPLQLLKSNICKFITWKLS